MANALNPTPQAGQGAFGMVPGVLPTPQPAADLALQLPGLPQLNQTASTDLQSKLGGTLSPGTLNALQNASATYGVGSGMPGSQLSWNSLYGNIAGASEAQQREGLADYGPFVGAVSSTQTVSPTLQTEIAGQNALNAAAPNPAQAASYSKQLFDQYLQQMKGPGGGTVTGMPTSLFPMNSNPAASVLQSTRGLGTPATAGGYGAGYDGSGYDASWSGGNGSSYGDWTGSDPTSNFPDAFSGSGSLNDPYSMFA